MASNAELLEAQAHARRRLLVAFVTGRADAGADLPRPWRPLVIGALLAGMLVAGAAAQPWVSQALANR